VYAYAIGQFWKKKAKKIVVLLSLTLVPPLGKVAKCSRTVQVFFKKRKKIVQVIWKGVHQGEF